ncbi:hypothetical protein [Phenylobacterium sp.]|uniref:hypothetical protein n=1 Tax=Phenylobacterium sp. TaxID=1871053 RepID=UPI003982F7C7
MALSRLDDLRVHPDERIAIQPHGIFNQERHLISRDLYRERRSAALAEWRAVMG